MFIICINLEVSGFSVCCVLLHWHVPRLHTVGISSLEQFQHAETIIEKLKCRKNTPPWRHRACRTPGCAILPTRVFYIKNTWLRRQIQVLSTLLTEKGWSVNSLCLACNKCAFSLWREKWRLITSTSIIPHGKHVTGCSMDIMKTDKEHLNNVLGNPGNLHPKMFL